MDCPLEAHRREGKSPLIAAQPATRRAISWLAVTVGALLGLLGLVMSGLGWIDDDYNSPVWLTSRFEAFGPGLFGLLFLVASFSALRNRRHAGLIFLGGAPLVSFVLSYPGAGYLIWTPDGAGTFHLPLLPTAVGLSCLFYLPFVAPLLVMRNRRRALSVCLVAAVLAALLFAASRWTAALLPRLAGWSVLFLMFGGFWLGTHRRAWPALRAPANSPNRLITIAARSFLVAFLSLAGILAVTAWRSSLWTADCSGSQLFVRPLRPEHVVITARVIRAAHTAKIAGRWAGDWAIGIVEERFWGLPLWPRVVLLTNSMFWEGKTFFISGSRSGGFLTRHLPIVDARACGSYFSRPVADANLELRLLREAPAAGESRTIGYVLGANPSLQMPKASVPLLRETNRTTWLTGWFTEWRRHEGAEVYEYALNSPKTHGPIAGARIVLTGPFGTTVLTTDRDGIYELPNLPADDYTLRLLDVPANQFCRDLMFKKEYTMKPGLHRMDMVADWVGSIEGAVRDAAGAPAAVMVELRNLDGSNADRGLGSFGRTDGSFRFENLPAGGRYLVLINRFGPSVQSPYPSMYYPSAKRPEDGRILEIRGSGHIKNVDFSLTRLPERRLRVRVAWPDHQAVDGASVSVVYGQAGAHVNLNAPSESFTTDRTGVAQVSIFGDARVKVQASIFNPEEVLPPFCSYSGVVELETSRLPTSMDLLVGFAPAHHAVSK